jgi:hypothetical protein
MNANTFTAFKMLDYIAVAKATASILLINGIGVAMTVFNKLTP